MTTVEGNKLIDEFMQLPVSMVHGALCYADWDGMHSVKYHESWDWLMPVVEKVSTVFNQMDFIEIAEMPKSAQEIWELKICAPSIAVVWFAVVSFIQWYNQQKK